MEQDPVVELRRWLARQAKSAAELAEEIGVSRQAVHYWLSRERRPGLLYAARLERLTGIPASLWAREAIDAA